MSLIDKFLDAIKLNDDYDDDDEFLDDDFDDEDDYDDKPKRRFFKKFSDDDEDLDDYDDEKPVSKSPAVAKDPKPSYKPHTTAAGTLKTKNTNSSKITPMRKKTGSSMEVSVIRPTSMENTREIADTLLDSCTVILNLEGVDVDVAQRIVDFTCGACYSLNGNLQKISSYIFILTPADVDISGDFQEVLSGAFDIPSMRTNF